MNAETILRNEANHFTSGYQRGADSYNAHKEFKDSLKRELYNYYQPLDKLIFLYQVDKNFDEYYKKHLEKCTHKENPEQCATNMFFMKSKFFIEQEIKALNPDFEYKILRPQVNSDLIKRNLIELKVYPEAAKSFQKAIDKLNEERLNRNLLDDLRLSIETLLREILNNEKSLENQFDLLGKHLKQNGTSKEITNMFRSVIYYYSKYQNEYVKHDDKVKKEEIEFMVNISSAMISFLINNK